MLTEMCSKTRTFLSQSRYLKSYQDRISSNHNVSLVPYPNRIISNHIVSFL